MFYDWASRFSIHENFLFYFWVSSFQVFRDFFLFFLFCLVHQVEPQVTNFWPPCFWSTFRKLFAWNLWKPEDPHDVSLLPLSCYFSRICSDSVRVCLSDHRFPPWVMLCIRKMVHACNWKFIFSVLHCPNMDIQSSFYTEKVCEDKSTLVSYRLNWVQHTALRCLVGSILGVSVGIFLVEIHICTSRLQAKWMTFFKIRMNYQITLFEGLTEPRVV